MEEEKELLKMQKDITEEADEALQSEPADNASGNEEDKKEEEKTFSEKICESFYDLASVMTAAIVTIAVIFTFAFRFVGVSGESMLPTLNHGDWLIVTAYDHKPQYGQVVIVTQPFQEINEPIVKRIIATGGQTIDIDTSNGTVTVDGKVLDEPYINNSTITPCNVTFPYTVEEGCVFVMGDNRQHSLDSRLLTSLDGGVGVVREEYILGVVKDRIIETQTDSLTGKTKMKLVSPSDWKVN